MAGVYDAIRVFALEHSACADPEGYGVWASCSCGARFERWVSPRDAEADLFRSTLLAFEN